MFDFGCHRIEVLVNLFGPVSKVASMVTNTVFDREVEDTATAVLQFESGTAAVLSVTHATSEPATRLIYSALTVRYTFRCSTKGRYG